MWNPPHVYTIIQPSLARIFYELLSRDHEDGSATWQPQGVGSETYLNGTSQGPTPEDARQDGHIRDRSKLFMKCPGSGYCLAAIIEYLCFGPPNSISVPIVIFPFFA